jgi:hypothetical protein
MTMDFIERAECLLDTGSLGNLNFTIIGTYTGPLRDTHLQQGLAFLQTQHRMLRVALSWEDGVCQFRETSSEVPLTRQDYHDFPDWKAVATRDVRRRFDDPDLPLWRTSWLDGNGQGQIILSFHHAIADGVCGMQLMDHLFSALARLIHGKPLHPILIEAATPLPESLFPLAELEPEEDVPVPTRVDQDHHTSYILDEIEASATGRIVDWAKARGIRVHSILFAALLQAVKRVTPNPHATLDALTVVNFRPFYEPGLSRDVMKLTRVCITTEAAVTGREDLGELADFIHADIYRQLAAGEPILNLKRIARRVERQESPTDLWCRARYPAHTVTLTNVGMLDFSGDYDGISLDKLFFIANVEPFFEAPDNWVLGAVTFRGQLFLTLWYLEELVDEETARRVLSETKRILSGL